MPALAPRRLGIRKYRRGFLASERAAIDEEGAIAMNAIKEEMLGLSG